MAKVRKKNKRGVNPGQFLVRGAVLGALVAVTVAVFLSWPPAVTASQTQSNPRSKKYIATLEITVDKQTGALRKPTAEETQELVATLMTLINTSSEGLTAMVLPSSATVVDLEGRFAPVMLAKPNANGTTEVKCVTTFEEATAFLGLVEDPSQQ